MTWKPVLILIAGFVIAASIALLRHERGGPVAVDSRAIEAGSEGAGSSIADDEREEDAALDSVAQNEPAEAGQATASTPIPVGPITTNAQDSSEAAERARAQAQGLGPDWPDLEQISTPESEWMETEVLNFLSQRTDFGITSIPELRCDARNCKLQVTGLVQQDLAQLMRELMADERLPLTDARFRFQSFGFGGVELLIEYDAKSLSDTLAVQQALSAI